jgi:hypothetical protein
VRRGGRASLGLSAFSPIRSAITSGPSLPMSS